jgi:hypothetical protein
MMDGDAKLAARYLTRAAEVRGIAQTITDEKANKVLLEVAADYEQMARALNEMAREPRLRSFSDDRTLIEPL